MTRRELDRLDDPDDAFTESEIGDMARDLEDFRAEQRRERGLSAPSPAVPGESEEPTLPEWADSWVAGNCGCGWPLVRVECYCGGHTACSETAVDFEDCPLSVSP